MTPALEIKAIDGYVEAEVTKQKEILLRLTDFDDLVVGVLMDDQQVRWLIDYLSKHLRIAPEVAEVEHPLDPLAVALIEIALMPDEDNEWDGTDKFREAREKAMKALNWKDGRPQPQRNEEPK